MSAVILQFRRPEPQPQAPEEAPHFTVEFELPKPGMDAKAYHDAWSLLLVHAREARAWWKYTSAKSWRLALTDPDERDLFRNECEDAFARMLAFVDKVTRAPIPQDKPSMMAMHLRSKRSIIGRLWLNCEGPRYDEWRALVAADEARLEGVKRERRAKVASR